MPASRFGRFTVLGEIGAGGMGRVYRAHAPTLRREVAIKVLHGDSGDRQGDLLAEARSASTLNHPNICTIYDIGDVDGASFIAMELVEGRPLNPASHARRSRRRSIRSRGRPPGSMPAAQSPARFRSWRLKRCAARR